MKLKGAGWPLLVLLLELGVCRETPARVLLVSPRNPAATLQDFVARASPGDTLRIEPGTYQGNVVLDKPLILEGRGKPVLRGDGHGSVITVNAPRCTLRGLVMEHSGGMLVDEDSGILLKSDGNRIEENDLRDILFGIYLFHSNGNSIQGNSIQGRVYLELGERGSGIHIWNSSRNTIIGNTIREARDGMYLQNASRSTIRGNHISNLRYGLHYMFSDDNVFEENVFEHNVAGAAIMYSRHIQFRRNLFLHNRGFSSFGVLFQENEDCLAEDNLIVDNEVGIFMEAHRSGRFLRNLIAANDTAIETFSSATGNTFEENNFIGNLRPIWVIGKNTGNRWSGEKAGNYWSEYEGYDLDGNGIGDSPFRIQNLFEHLEGNHPRLRLYFFSPAAQALALAEKTFPVIAGSNEYDPRPLMKPMPMAVAMPASERASRVSLFGLVLPALMVGVSGAIILRGNHR